MCLICKERSNTQAGRRHSNLIHRKSFELSAFDHAKVLTAISSFFIENDADIVFAIDKPVTKGVFPLIGLKPNDFFYR